MLPDNFREAKNKLKQENENLIIALRNRRHKKCFNTRRKGRDLQYIQGNVKGHKKQARSFSFGNVACDRERTKIYRY